MNKYALVFALSFTPAMTMLASVATAADVEQAPQISLKDLKQVVTNKKATIIDANGIDMYKDGHIPGAVSYAKDGTKLAAILPADKNAEIVAYCGGPMCTAWEDAAKAVKALGYNNVKHFKGGIKGWKEAGEKVEKGA